MKVSANDGNLVVARDLQNCFDLSNGKVLYTLDYSENWQGLSHQRKPQIINSYNIPLFERQIPIDDDKFKQARIRSSSILLRSLVVSLGPRSVILIHLF